MYKPVEKEIFHIHTRRCMHASDAPDWNYIVKAIELGADRIVFTDHCPFPGDIFGNRMREKELLEYLSSLQFLKEKYCRQIEVNIGLEVEWIPKFEGWIEALRKREDIDLLIMGQHMYEHDGTYSFMDEDKSKEYIGLCNAMAEGAATGYFDVIAHPDRAFRRCKKWTDDMERAGKGVIDAAVSNNIYLEKNYTSMQCKRQYWEPFWESAGEARQLYGYDAHSVADLTKIWSKYELGEPIE